MSTTFDPPFLIPKIRCQIRNQWPQRTLEYKVPRKSLAFQNIISAILGPPFRIPKIRCQIHNQPPPKLLSTEFCGYCVVFQNSMSGILDVRHFAKGIAIWDRWDKFFLAVQLFRSPLIIVRIKSQYSFGSKKNYEKQKFPIFWYFSPNLAPYWIFYWTKLNFDHGFLKSTPKTIRKHGFRLQISRFQSSEWGLTVSQKIVVLGR